jgi:hypothetical protein
MSTFRTPVGPQPSRIYWRRRLVVALGLLAVVAIVLLIVVRPGAGSGGTPTTTKTPTPTRTSSASSAPKACDPDKVTLEAVTDSASYAAGVNPVLSFTLKSTMTVPCTIAAGSDVQEFRITSGDERIWSSKDCQTDPVAADIVLEAGVPKAGPTLTWDRTRSSTTTCAGARSPVIAGGASYHLTVIVGDLTSAKTKQFLLN